MTVALPPPKRRNPVLPVQAPVPFPAARSRAAMGLAAMAAEGRFALQRCPACGTVQYPPRDVCVRCLGDDLPWTDLPAGGTLLSVTTTRISGERWVRERAPWKSGLVRADAGPSIVAHLHAAPVVGDRVRLDLKLDAAGRGAVVAFPEGAVPVDDPELRRFTADPRQRRVLITDGRAATGPALAQALTHAGAAKIFLGVAEPWKPFAPPALPGIEIVPLDLTDTISVGEAAARIGDKVDILINNAGLVRPGGLIGGVDPVRMRDLFETNCLGLGRLASAFGPVMRARAAERERNAAAFVTLLSAWALAPPPEWAAYAATQAAARVAASALRAEMRVAGLRVVEVLSGPIDDEWHQVVKPPKVTPAALAAAVVRALREGHEEVVVGDVARELHARWVDDPRILRQEGP